VSTEDRDLGFGAVVAQQSRRRLLNTDGTFNVRRLGRGLIASINPYHSLLTMRWHKFLAILVAFYFAINIIFGGLFYLCGPDALTWLPHHESHGRLWDTFFFSVQTFATIGYGGLAPTSIASNVIVTIESLVGILCVALTTGVIFARFSRPVARIRFSSQALIGPYRGGKAFMFRVANERDSQILELSATVLFTRFEERDGRRIRQFYPLSLERTSVMFFPLAWTVVHPIDRESPLDGVTRAALEESEAEVLVLLRGTDETFSELVHARSSYRWDQIRWGARFASVFNLPGPDGTISIDVGRLDEVEDLPTLVPGSAKASA
jgi:inward rectifier potassium channel